MAAGLEHPRSKMAEDLAAQRAACERRIAAGRDRFASASAAYRADAFSARSGAHQNLSRREDLDGLNKQLRDLEADLGQALSLKLATESKCERIRESISSSAATSEQLSDLVTDQRNRRERHATVISNVLEAVEALEAKNDEDDTWRTDIEKSVCWYQKCLGLQAIVEGEGVKFVFDKVDLQSPEKEFSFSLKFDKDRYTLLRCSPPVEDSEELMKDLNLTNDLVKFVRIIRQRFQAAALNGTLPVSPTVCSDASAIPMSSPVIKPVDSRSKNDRDKSNSRSKNRKRRAAALSAASPGSVRRSPRFVGHKRNTCIIRGSTRKTPTTNQTHTTKEGKKTPCAFRLDPIAAPSPTSISPPSSPRPTMARAKPSAAKKNQAAQQNGGGGGHAAPSKLARYLDPEAPWDKDQLLDAVHWIRQAVGLACGLVWGSVPLVGAAWIVLFVAISSGIIYWYYAHLLKVDEEEFGGHGALLQEGMFASFTLFLLSWILVYSLAHF